jgi:hypothetical protein
VALEVIGSNPIIHPSKPTQSRNVLRFLYITDILGCSQGVRQRTLTPSFAGPNPAIPAKTPALLCGSFTYYIFNIHFSPPNVFKSCGYFKAVENGLLSVM